MRARDGRALRVFPAALMGDERAPVRQVAERVARKRAMAVLLANERQEARELYALFCDCEASEGTSLRTSPWGVAPELSETASHIALCSFA
eukprot:CAMPEP_0181209376 /NCGR_PEP_ID=MMETSP1096-20121128/22636_1 /TAXON_ID=156174 ORGANISM="Chrysochromulina ericina, Strain CCMP281" /NCGR_SAMPLE_ID=MMETSP1096 /ASSEMBLY_ACC=CAM_ASM_000453 /LENGTH=90 /DNA_ID=CAMNT_0023300539 /DNA_START=365 /DNA_END=638 /DNA_ORIENTATION=-